MHFTFFKKDKRENYKDKEKDPFKAFQDFKASLTNYDIMMSARELLKNAHY